MEVDSPKDPLPTRHGEDRRRLLRVGAAGVTAVALTAYSKPRLLSFGPLPRALAFSLPEPDPGNGPGPCSVRYYLSTIVGDGTFIVNPFRSKVATLVSGMANLIPVDTVNGHPTSAWTLVFVNIHDHTPLLHDPDIAPFPAVDLDTRLSTLSPADAVLIPQALARFGIDQGFLSSITTLREVIRHVAQLLESTADENFGFVSCN